MGPVTDSPAPSLDLDRGETPTDVGGRADVPHIAIHVFHDTPDMATFAQRILSDRRMAKVQWRILPGGLGAATDLYRSETTPQLIIVEWTKAARNLLDQLDRLAEVCDADTKVMIIGLANDIGLYRELIRRGISDYLVAPLKIGQVIEAIANLFTDPEAPFIGRMVAFVGAKGGVGSSILAHKVAYALSESVMASTVLVDLDLAFGTSGLDFNQDPTQGIADALSQPDRVDDVLLDRFLVQITERLSLFSAPASLERDFDYPPEAYMAVASKIRRRAPYVVWDLPHLWSPWVRQMIIAADDVVIVSTPDLAALRNSKALIDLIRQARPNDPPPRLVLNQVGVTGRPEIPPSEFGEAIGLAPSLILPWEPKLFGQAANNGQMIHAINPKAKVSEGLNRLAQMISRREGPSSAKTSLLSSLFKRS